MLLTLGAGAQAMKDPSSWTMKVVPANGAYDLVFHVDLQPGWHVWSNDVGGDGMLIPTAISFENGSHRPVGNLRESGKIIETTMDGVDGKVRYYSGQVEFIQTVKGASGDIVKGEYTYQLCNEMMCLPPKTKPFSLRLP